MQESKTTTKRPRKDEIASVLKLLSTTAKQQRNYADGNRKAAPTTPYSAYRLKSAEKQEKTADRYERVASWIASL